ncbi:MAG: ester cyclase [Anaerolineales bacterium]|nr:ester cyclase [Anaerolineales bacterium]
MSIQENKLFIRRYFDMFNQGGAEAVAQLITDQHLKDHIAFFEGAFPGYQLSAREMVAEGDKVVVDALMTGTHEGPLMEMSPTGKAIKVPFIIIYRLAGGKIVDHTMVADQAGLMQQLSAT